MTTRYDLPPEIQNLVLEYILSNRTISQTCPFWLCCLACPRADYFLDRSDVLTLRLVSKKFIDVPEASRILFSSAKLAAHHAASLESMTNSKFPYKRIRHLELPKDCDPVRSTIAFSIENLKNTLPNLQSIAIHTPYPLHYQMPRDGAIYVHAYEILRNVKAFKDDSGLTQYITWPKPPGDDLEAARNRALLILKSTNLRPNPYVNPLSHPKTSCPTAGQNILAASLDYYATMGPHYNVDPYLTTWHARLIHDAHSDPSQSVRVTIHAPLELSVFLSAHARKFTFTVRHTTICSTDMKLRFALNGTEVRMAQVLNQSWFDSRFQNASVAGWEPVERAQVALSARFQ